MSTPRFELHDTVKARVALPGVGVRAGDMGAVVHLFDKPEVAYLVEFANDRGETLAEVVMKAGQLESVAA